MSFDEEPLSDHHECQREIAALEARLAQVAAETRAAVLAEEERRVWVAAWAHWQVEDCSPETCRVLAEKHLAAYREARAAWDARGEKR